MKEGEIRKQNQDEKWKVREKKLHHSGVQQQEAGLIMVLVLVDVALSSVWLQNNPTINYWDVYV